MEKRLVENIESEGIKKMINHRNLPWWAKVLITTGENHCLEGIHDGNYFFSDRQTSPDRDSLERDPEKILKNIQRRLSK